MAKKITDDDDNPWNRNAPVRSLFSDDPSDSSFTNLSLSNSTTPTSSYPSTSSRRLLPSQSQKQGGSDLSSNEIGPITNRRFFQSLPDEDLSPFLLSTPKQECYTCRNNIYGQLKVLYCEGDYVFCNEICLRKTLEDSIEYCSPRLSMLSTTPKRGGSSTVLPIATYTSLKSLKYLLKYALKSKNGAIITKILLRIHDIYDHGCFLNCLFDNPQAMDHYINFLIQTNQRSEAQSLLIKLGRTEDAQMLKYKEIRDDLLDMRPAIAEKRLESFLRENVNVNQNSLDLELIREHIELIKLQTQMEQKGVLQKLNDEMGGIPQSLHNYSLVDTIHYHILAHNFKTSQETFSTSFKINDKSFAWMALQALITRDQLNILLAFLKEKKFFKSNECILPPVRLIFSLYSLGISGKQLQEFFIFLPDVDAFCKLAVQLKIFDEAYGHLIKQKNKKSMEIFLSHLPENCHIRPSVKQMIDLPTSQWWPSG